MSHQNRTTHIDTATTGPADLTAWSNLIRAGRLMAARGKCRDDYSDQLGRVDLMGALRLAAFDDADAWASTEPAVNRGFERAHDLLRAYLTEQFGPDLHVSDFSDLCVLDGDHGGDILCGAAAWAMSGTAVAR